MIDSMKSHTEISQALVVKFIEKVDYWKLVRVIFDLTGWDKAGTYHSIGRGRKPEEEAFRRSLIDYIAVKNGCSYSFCARATGRYHTTVLNSVRRFEERLETDAHTRAFFKEVMDYIRENYHIYENQNINETNI